MAAERNLPLVTAEPAMESVGVSGGKAAIGLVKTANHKFSAVGVGYPVAMPASHFDTVLFAGYRCPTGQTVNGFALSFG